MIIELLREDQGCLICSIRPIYEVFYAIFFFYYSDLLNTLNLTKQKVIQ